MRNYSKQYIQVFVGLPIGKEGSVSVNSYCGYVKDDNDEDFIRLEPFELEDGYLDESIKEHVYKLMISSFPVDIRKDRIIAIHILPKV